MIYRYLQFEFYLLLLGLLSASCNDKKVSWDDASSEKYSYKTFFGKRYSDSIDFMGNKAWDKSMYQRFNIHIGILQDSAKISQADYEALINGLNQTYSNVLVRETTEIMSSESCSSKHADLYAMAREIDTVMARIKNKETLLAIKKRIDRHREICNYRVGNVEPSSVNSQYDESFIDVVLPKKAEFEREKYPCKTVNGSIGAILPALNERHVHFLDALVLLYIGQDQYDDENRKAVSKEIDKYYYTDNTGKYSVYKANESEARRKMDEWYKKMDEFKQQKQNN